MFHGVVHVLISASCSWIHGLGIFVVFLKEKAQQLWKLKQVLPPCPCKDLVEKKGIFVRRHLGNGSKIMFNMTKTYL